VLDGPMNATAFIAYLERCLVPTLKRGDTVMMDSLLAPSSKSESEPKNDPSDGAETGVAEPHVAEQSRSWRAASGVQGVMRGS